MRTTKFRTLVITAAAAVMMTSGVAQAEPRTDANTQSVGSVAAWTSSPGSYIVQPLAEETIDWNISSTIIGPAGEDLPLRIGQRDSVISEGFGIVHIQQGHGGFVPDAGLIEQVVERCTSNPNPNAITECSGVDSTGRSFFVAYTERVDSRSGDGRPVGIITAYYP